MKNTDIQRTEDMRNTIENVKSIADSIKETDILWSASNLLFCFERGNLDEHDFYSLTRDIISLVSDVTVLKEEIKSLA